MKIIYQQSLVEYIEQLNEVHPVNSVEVSHYDIRKVEREFDRRFEGRGYHVDNENHVDRGYPGCSGEVTLNGITYIPTDNTEDFA